MFISYCRDGKGIIATGYSAKMSPQFEEWFYTLPQNEQNEISLDIYVLIYCYLKGFIGDDLLSVSSKEKRSARVVPWEFTKIKKSKEFVKWLASLDKPTRIMALKRIDRFRGDKKLAGQELTRDSIQGKPATTELKFGPKLGYRIYIYPYHNEKQGTDKLLCLVLGGSQSGSKGRDPKKQKDDGIRADEMINDPNFNPYTWRDYYPLPENFGEKKKK